MSTLTVRPATDRDRDWIRALLIERWTATQIASRGRLVQADLLPAGIAELDGQRVGLATYEITGPDCELVTLDSLRERAGVGTALLNAVADAARTAGCRRLWLITTNDNLHALAFYQRRGLRLVALHAGALDLSRQLKPTIPLIGLDNIPLRDELELDLPL